MNELSENASLHILVVDAGEVLAIIRDWEQTQKPYG